MSLLASVVASIVALLHVGFFVLESLLWTKPTGRKTFGLSAQDAETTRVLAANQGVYNLMVAVSLVWGVVAANPSIVTVQLVFVAAVGLYGAVTVKPTIFVLQALPALIGLAVLTLGF